MSIPMTEETGRWSGLTWSSRGTSLTTTFSRTSTSLGVGAGVIVAPAVVVVLSLWW